MKRLLFLSVLSVFSVLPFYAEDDYSLYILSTGTDTPATYSVAEIQKLTFNNGNVVVTKTDGTTASFGMNAITSMYVDVSPADGIESLTETLTKSDDAEIYDLQGRRVAASTDLPKGVYIVNQGGKNHKIIKR